MPWLDTALKILTIVVSLVVALLGAQLWKVRAENRRANSEANSNDATAASTVTATALSLVGPLSVKNTELNAALNLWERYEVSQRSWNALVARTAEEAGVTLPPPPDPPY